MFSDHDNPVSAAAAAPAHDAQSEVTPEKKPATQQENPAPQEDADAAHEQLKAEVSAGVPAAPQPEAAEVQAKAEAHAEQSATDAEAAAAAEEAAGSEEMSKLLDQYDEQHETPAQNEIIE